MNNPLSDLSRRFTSSRTPGTPDARPLHKRKRVYAGGFVLVALGAAIGGSGGEDTAQASPAPRPTVTATETVPVPEPAVTITETPDPLPEVTVTETVEADAPADDGYSYDDSDSSSDSGGDVYYENCAAARAAGAAPVHRGEPGYASHLDRDNDGTGCDWG